ncbi:uncharacterized protein MEPE_03777 [Melanopsichium pennsylvanicum]|uniref:Phytanoyl-dioxygenase family protein n=2 Tax=Melanopsichium pennsylvanicum TaxID=63383 RepID=A0AAJ4XMV0_9BASI|nr:conserved hypothetical protein [Melanopsichium pennsylvanicum 4]SNX85068.1 uncharacterized protein MEPE_03777 [Melanopsichium pennsylvanicum]
MTVEDTLSNTDATSRLRSLGYDSDLLLQQYYEQGYIILDHILSTEPDSCLHLDNLRHCAELATRLTRDGHWSHRRVVGRAFPPFTKDNLDSWGVQHIMNPQLDMLAATPLSKTFQHFYGSPILLDIASLLIGADKDQMQMELFNLLINPSCHLFALSWHRDDVKPNVSQTEEQSRLETPTYGVQFNTALFDDNCLFVVPGTHRRLRTPLERTANNTKAPPPTLITETQASEESQFFAQDGSWQSVDPPNTFRVKLKAGQTAFYSQRILHRASYLPSVKRATLHGCFGDASEGGKGAAERARNVLQHGVEWMRDPQFGKDLPESLKPMWANLIRMDAAYANKQLGFSLDND